MHYSNLLRVSVTLVLSAHRVLGQAIIPYKDGQCTQPVTKYTLNGNAEPESIWANSNGWPSVSRYSNPVFPGAEAKSGGGYNVYWKIGEPGPGCRVAIMTPYSQSSYGSLGFHAPPGNVVLVAKKAGCYFSSIPQGQDFSSTYCCGVGDCKYISVGNSALLKREEEDASLSLFSRESAAESDSIIPRRTSNSLTGRAAEYAALQARDDNFDTSNCKANVKGSPFPQAGQQVLVANPQRCDSAPCSFSVSHGVTVGTSFSTSQTTSITNTVGASISLEAGVDFIASAKVTATASYSLAVEVSKTTDTTITNSTTVSVTNTVGQQLGTYAFVTFTPTYLCWTTTLDCGKGPGNAFHFCQPQMGSDGKLLEGDYTVVYTG